MNPLGRIGASLTRYRKRKLPLEGRVAGVDYGRYRRGFDRAAQTGHTLQRAIPSEYTDIRQAESYDPQAAFYQSDLPAYEQPAPWHDAPAWGTPSPTPDPGMGVDMQQQMEPAIDHYLAGWMLRRWLNERATGAHDNVDIHALFDPERTVRLKIGEIHDQCERIDAYESSVAVGDVVREVIGDYGNDHSALDADLCALRKAVIAMTQETRGDWSNDHSALDADLHALREAVIALQAADPTQETLETPGGEAIAPEQLDGVDNSLFQGPDALPFVDEVSRDMGTAGPDCPDWMAGVPFEVPTETDYLPAQPYEAAPWLVPESGGAEAGPFADATGADPLNGPGPACDMPLDQVGGPFGPPGPDQPDYGMPLEQIVNDDMQELDPYAMMDPYRMMNPWGAMNAYGMPPGMTMSGMPMGPFGPMPPGLGPMGPMM